MLVYNDSSIVRNIYNDKSKMLNQIQLVLLVQMTKDSSQQTKSTMELDISHQEVRILAKDSLDKLSVTHFNGSYNYFKGYQSLQLASSASKSSKSLEWADLSFNFFTHFEQKVPTLFRNLKHLDLTANRIESVSLDDNVYPLLATLHLKNNLIKHFKHCPLSITTLTLDHNQLSSLAFTGGDSLRILSTSYNSIKDLAVTLPSAYFIDLQGNTLDQLDQVIALLQQTQKLLSINLLDNPVSYNQLLKVAVLENCKRIVQINTVTISPHVRQGFKMLKAEKRLEEVLQRSQETFEARIVQKNKVKQQLLAKLEADTKGVEQRYNQSLEEEKAQIELIVQHAKNTLGKNSLSILKEQRQFEKQITEIGAINQLKEEKFDKKEAIRALDRKQQKQFEQALAKKQQSIEQMEELKKKIIMEAVSSNKSKGIQNNKTEVGITEKLINHREVFDAQTEQERAIFNKKITQQTQLLLVRPIPADILLFDLGSRSALQQHYRLKT